MSGNFKKKDLRISKTYKSLKTSMVLLLSKRHFTKITVNDICEDALISRATFYTHFYDKYDFLRYILSQRKVEILQSINNCPQDKAISILNKELHKNAKLILNLIENYNNESITIITDCIIEILQCHFEKHENIKKNEALYRFCAGGILAMLVFKIQNKLLADDNIFNEQIYSLIKNII